MTRSVEGGAADPRGGSSRRPATRRKRRIWKALLFTLLVLAAIGGLIAWRLNRLTDDARLLANTGQEAIRMLGAYSRSARTRDAAELANLYVADFSAPEQMHWVVRPEGAEEKDGIRVFNWANEAPRAADRSAIVEQMLSYLRSLNKVEELKLKLARVESTDGREAVVRTVFWLRGETAEGRSHESHLKFRLGIRAAKGGWQIASQELVEGETVEGPRRGITDVTADAGLDFSAHINPAWSTPEWKPKTYEIVKYAAGGVSAADFDGDGWDDLFFADGAHSKLYRNRGDGTFEDATARVGLPEPLGAVAVATFADLDNDGDADLFLGRTTALNLLYRNNGDGTFTDVTEGSGIGGFMITVAAAGDYDRDGLLDLYLGRYLDPRTKLPTTLFYTRNGEGNSLLRNLGNLRFADVTQASGTREGGLTLGVNWADLDGDGWQDLYIANDFGRNALLHNNGDGTFSDRTEESGALAFGYNMSVHVGDIDNDLDLDIYTSSVHSGQRWYGQAPSLGNYLVTSFKQGTLWEDSASYREVYGYVGSAWHHYGDSVVKGNSLLLNDGRGHFREVAEAANANPFGWYWGSAMADMDLDGRQDIYAANGWITGKIPDDL